MACENEVLGVVTPPPSSFCLYFLFLLESGDFGTIIRNSRQLPEAFCRTGFLHKQTLQGGPATELPNKIRVSNLALGA